MRKPSVICLSSLVPIGQSMLRWTALLGAKSDGSMRKALSSASPETYHQRMSCSGRISFHTTL